MSQRKRQPITDGIPAAGPSPDELAERYLSLVIPIARSFQKRLPSSVDFDDLVGAGNLGLVEAARRSGLLQSSASSFPQDPLFKLGEDGGQTGHSATGRRGQIQGLGHATFCQARWPFAITPPRRPAFPSSMPRTSPDRSSNPAPDAFW